LFFLGVPRRRRWAGLLGALVLLVVTASAIGCGGSSSSGTTGTGTSGTGTSGTAGTTAGAYTVTVTGVDAASGKIAETTAVAVTVN
jgi:hypothetical protein